MTKLLSILAAIICIGSLALKASGNSTGSFKIAATPGIDNRKNCRPGHTAFAVSRNDLTFYWKPAKRSGSVLGEAALTDAIISADGSLLLIAENTGNSTRLILFNLISKKICNGYLLNDRQLTKLAFLPGKKYSIAALQQEPNQISRIIFIDLRSGKITAEHKINGAVQDFTCSKNELFFTCAYRISKISISQPDAPPADVMEINPAGGLIALSCDHKVLARLIPGRLEFYELSVNGLIPLNDLSLPNHNSFEWIVPAMPGNTTFFIGSRQRAAFYVYGGVLKRLTPLAGSIPSLVPDRQEFILNLAVNDQIQRCALPECTKIITVNPRGLRPVNRNGTFRVLVQSSDAKNVRLVQIDNRGNIFNINVSNRRSKKELLLLTDNHGVQ